MKLNTLYIFFAIILTYGQGFAQPTPYGGTFLFNLTEQQYPSNILTVDDLKNKDIYFLSFDKESIVKYDTANKAFSITTKGFETKHFAIVHKNDTIFIDYPSLLGVSTFVKMPIPLESSKSYSFSNQYIYDAIHSNKNKYLNDIFYLCQGCFLSRYEMKEESVKRLKESIHWGTSQVKDSSQKQTAVQPQTVAQRTDSLKKEKKIQNVKPKEKQAKKNSSKNIDSLYKALLYQADLYSIYYAGDKAKELYNKALKLKPNEKYPKEKIEEIEALEIDKVLSVPFDNIISKGDSCRQKKDYEKARKYYQEALKIKRIGYYSTFAQSKIENMNAEIKVQDSLKSITTINLDTINQIDKNYSRQGYWIIWAYMNQRQNYSLTAKVEEGKYLDGKKEGVWKGYSSKGILQSEIIYKNGHAGDYKTFFENGCVMEEGTCHQNNRWINIGKYKAYYDCNCLQYEFNFNKNGKKEGEQKYYYKDCKTLMLKVYCENGNEKISTRFDTAGNVTRVDTFKIQEKTKYSYGQEPMMIGVFDTTKNNKQTAVQPQTVLQVDTTQIKKTKPPFMGDGDTTLYNLKGQLVYKGTFKKYKLINGFNYIYQDDILVQIAVYKNGQYIGNAPIEENKK